MNRCNKLIVGSAELGRYLFAARSDSHHTSVPIPAMRIPFPYIPTVPSGAVTQACRWGSTLPLPDCPKLGVPIGASPPSQRHTGDGGDVRDGGWTGSAAAL